jgi:hypothetical protein
MLLQSVIAGQAFREFGEVGYATAMTIALYCGMFVGSLFWGLGADIIGRRHAFNFSLIICCIATIVAGAMPNWPSLGFFISLIGFGAGGNLVLDTTVFLEFLPGNKQWVVTMMACWWGIGQAITGFFAWGFLGMYRNQDPMRDMLTPCSPRPMELRFRRHLHPRQQHGLALRHVRQRRPRLCHVGPPPDARPAQGDAQVPARHGRGRKGRRDVRVARQKVQPPLHPDS